MPRRDGTGPDGQGARTGRGLGPCDVDEGMGRGIGRGIGISRGIGIGRSRGIGRGDVGQGVGRGNIGGRRRGR